MFTDHGAKSSRNTESLKRTKKAERGRILFNKRTTKENAVL